MIFSSSQKIWPKDIVGLPHMSFGKMRGIGTVQAHPFSNRPIRLLESGMMDEEARKMIGQKKKTNDDSRE